MRLQRKAKSGRGDSIWVSLSACPCFLSIIMIGWRCFKVAENFAVVFGKYRVYHNVTFFVNFLGGCKDGIVSGNPLANIHRFDLF